MLPPAAPGNVKNSSVVSGSKSREPAQLLPGVDGTGVASTVLNPPPACSLAAAGPPTGPPARAPPGLHPGQQLTAGDQHEQKGSGSNKTPTKGEVPQLGMIPGERIDPSSSSSLATPEQFYLHHRKMMGTTTTDEDPQLHGSTKLKQQLSPGTNMTEDLNKTAETTASSSWDQLQNPGTTTTLSQSAGTMSPDQINPDVSGVPNTFYRAGYKLPDHVLHGGEALGDGAITEAVNHEQLHDHPTSASSRTHGVEDVNAINQSCNVENYPAGYGDYDFLAMGFTLGKNGQWVPPGGDCGGDGEAGTLLTSGEDENVNTTSNCQHGFTSTHDDVAPHPLLLQNNSSSLSKTDQLKQLIKPVGDKDPALKHAEEQLKQALLEAEAAKIGPPPPALPGALRLQQGNTGAMAASSGQQHLLREASSSSSCSGTSEVVATTTAGGANGIGADPTTCGPDLLSTVGALDTALTTQPLHPGGDATTAAPATTCSMAAFNVNPMTFDPNAVAFTPGFNPVDPSAAAAAAMGAVPPPGAATAGGYFDPMTGVWVNTSGGGPPNMMYNGADPANLYHHGFAASAQVDPNAAYWNNGKKGMKKGQHHMQQMMQQNLAAKGAKGGQGQHQQFYDSGAAGSYYGKGGKGMDTMPGSWGGPGQQDEGWYDEHGNWVDNSWNNQWGAGAAGSYGNSWHQNHLQKWNTKGNQGAAASAANQKGWWNNNWHWDPQSQQYVQYDENGQVVPPHVVGNKFGTKAAGKQGKMMTSQYGKGGKGTNMNGTSTDPTYNNYYAYNGTANNINQDQDAQTLTPEQIEEEQRKKTWIKTREGKWWNLKKECWWKNDAPLDEYGNPIRYPAMEALQESMQALIWNTCSSSKRKKAMKKAEEAKQRKMQNPLTGEALLRVQEKTREMEEYNRDDGTRDELLLGPHIIVRRHAEEELRKMYGVRGLDAIRLRRRKHFRYACVYDVQIQDEQEEFSCVMRLGGNDGENMRNICRYNPEVHLLIKGEKDEALIIHVETSNQEAYEYAMQAIETTLHKVYNQFDGFIVDKDYVEQNMRLEPRKFEKNTDYISILERLEREEYELMYGPVKVEYTAANPLIKAVGDSEEGKEGKTNSTTPQKDSGSFQMFSGSSLFQFNSKPKKAPKRAAAAKKVTFEEVGEEEVQVAGGGGGAPTAGELQGGSSLSSSSSSSSSSCTTTGEEAEHEKTILTSDKKTILTTEKAKTLSELMKAKAATASKTSTTKHTSTASANISTKTEDDAHAHVEKENKDSAVPSEKKVKSEKKEKKKSSSSAEKKTTAPASAKETLLPPEEPETLLPKEDFHPPVEKKKKKSAILLAREQALASEGKITAIVPSSSCGSGSSTSVGSSSSTSSVVLSQTTPAVVPTAVKMTKSSSSKSSKSSSSSSSSSSASGKKVKKSSSKKLDKMETIPEESEAANSEVAARAAASTAASSSSSSATAVSVAAAGA
ncbi:unnamed protein product [Amoebophrya sp. A120]|nr:unnamed protein product [Amoebophrya sp. A120]|eukprot:GSA120T00024464001.1